MKEIKNLMDDLTDRLIQASAAYYNTHIEKMSDSEFDDMQNLLLSLENAYPEFRRTDSPNINVGSKITGELPKVEHDKPQYSLDKRYSQKEINDFFDTDNNELVGSVKGDGLTVVLHYRRHETTGVFVLSDGITRGDKYAGERVFAQCCAVANIPKVLTDVPDEITKITVRGEVVVPHDMLSVVNEGLAEAGKKLVSSCRALASGTIRAHDCSLSKDRGLMFYAFELQDSDGKIFEKENDKREFLSNMGFELLPYQVLRGEKEVNAYIELIQRTRMNLSFDIDGIVFIYNEVEKHTGHTNKYPLYSMAFKFPNKGKRTTVTEITWQSGRFSLTPVISIEPVVFDGVTVSKATAHNANFVLGLDDKGEKVRAPLGYQCEIELERSGEVIPKIGKVYLTEDSWFQKFTVPENCPVCKALTIKSGVDVCCSNANCPGVIKAELRHMVSRECLNLSGIGTETIDLFVEKGLLNKKIDLFDLHLLKNKILQLPGLAEKSVNSMMEQIKGAQNLSLDKVINALGIREIGSVSSRQLAELIYPEGLTGLLYLSKDKLINQKGIGEVMCKNILDFTSSEKGREIIFTFIMHQIGIKNSCEPVKQGGVLDGSVFVITGTMTKSRKELENDIKMAGGKISSSVSKKTSYLILGDSPGKSKFEDASLNNVRIITEGELYVLIEKGVV